MGLIPINIEDYFKSDEQSDLEKKGYYRDGLESRYYNGLFVPEQNIEECIKAINNAGYVINDAKSDKGDKNYIITLYGVPNSNFINDHGNN